MNGEGSLTNILPSELVSDPMEMCEYRQSKLKWTSLLDNQQQIEDLMLDVQEYKANRRCKFTSLEDMISWSSPVLSDVDDEQLHLIRSRRTRSGLGLEDILNGLFVHLLNYNVVILPAINGILPIDCNGKLNNFEVGEESKIVNTYKCEFQFTFDTEEDFKTVLSELTCMAKPFGHKMLDYSEGSKMLEMDSWSCDDPGFNLRILGFSADINVAMRWCMLKCISGFLAAYHPDKFKYYKTPFDYMKEILSCIFPIQRMIWNIDYIDAVFGYENNHSPPDIPLIICHSSDTSKPSDPSTESVSRSYVADSEWVSGCSFMCIDFINFDSCYFSRDWRYYDSGNLTYNPSLDDNEDDESSE